MKNRKTSWKTLGLIGALIGSLTQAPAQAGIISSPDSARARVEYTENATQFNKETFALASKGCEFARVYNYNGDSGDYTAAALTTSAGTLFGTAGDKDGIGTEIPLTFGNTTLKLGAEKANGENRKLGAGITHKEGKLTSNLAYDNVNTSTGNRNQVLVSGFVTEANDQVGAAYVKSGLEGNLNANSTDAFWCHFGPKEEFGTRTWAKYDWNDNNGNSKLTWSSINAQNPTFSAGSSPWIVDRTSFGDMYPFTVTENANAGERVPLGCRSRQGFVSELSGFVNEGATETKCAKLEAGYNFGRVARVNPTLTTSYSCNLENNDADKVGGSLLVTAPVAGGTLVLETIANQNLSRTVAPSMRAEFYGSISYSKSF